MAKILILLSNHATLGDTGEANGTYAPELTHTVHEFDAAGVAYDLVSIEGGAAPIYGAEVEDGINDVILANAEFQQQVQNTIAFEDIDAADYSGVFYPGGYGVLYDLAFNETVGSAVAGLYEAGAPVGAVCHGPAGLLPIKLSSGNSILSGKSVTGFTREEEIDFNTIEHIPYLLEEKLARAAGKYSKVGPWGEHVISDERIITGQNPASAAGVGRAIIQQIQSA
ncbi:MAG: type 1 glutamine amidotransferase domain-containing protein [Kordiimonadaceae bacterium]|nr:type 1 glutamine amidotransferase domain-containing protein [Kordiimonadaceae bacterium]MBO6570111.1 type 1 glutamine amidotransferase domain-containing protein [Kordiimonadaceae bacterium]MBO6965791.1 type 1 glutamine amidotransferase domain-containing protein [Kordiimonadaceae bacterium]